MNLLDVLTDNPASQGADATRDDLRQWSVRMFIQHETILRDVFIRVAGDAATLTQCVEQLERGHLEAAQVVTVL